MVGRSGDDWQTVDEIWISDGTSNDRAKVRMRTRFANEIVSVAKQ